MLSYNGGSLHKKTLSFGFEELRNVYKAKMKWQIMDQEYDECSFNKYLWHTLCGYNALAK